MEGNEHDSILYLATPLCDTRPRWKGTNTTQYFTWQHLSVILGPDGRERTRLNTLPGNTSLWYSAPIEGNKHDSILYLATPLCDTQPRSKGTNTTQYFTWQHLSVVLGPYRREQTRLNTLPGNTSLWYSAPIEGNKHDSILYLATPLCDTRPRSKGTNTTQYFTWQHLSVILGPDRREQTRLNTLPGNTSL